jgi:biopolymer transport protein ExbD
MSRRRKKKKHGEAEVELNMAAMLDMAFQLLAFFILTFKPAPVEGQISLRMPPPIPVTTQKGADIGKDDTNDPLEGLNRLTVSVVSDKKGEIKQMRIGENTLRDQPTQEQELAQFAQKLPTYFKGTPADEMVLQIGSGLRYENVMAIVEICHEQKLNNGENLSKLTWTEYPDGSLEPEAPPK